MIKTNYLDIVKELIQSLELLVEQDLGDQHVRDACANAMYRTHYQISDIQERDFAYKIMNDAGDLESETVLDLNHPKYDDELKNFEVMVRRIISYLKEVQSYK